MPFRKQFVGVGAALAMCAWLACVSPARAWNGTGHMTVAAVAYDNLTPAARARVDALLQKHRDYGLWMSQKPAGYADKARFAFMKAATWPDDIRGTPDSHPAWHYIDVPVVAPGYAPAPAATAVPDPNAETQIVAETAVLTQAGAADNDRAFALCWVEHLIGDVHMPLHSANLFSPAFPQGDKGGNAESLADGAAAGDPLETAANPHNLHALWDDILGNDHDPADIDKVAAGLETASYARASFPQLARDRTVHAWVMESNGLAQNVVYIGNTLPMTAPTPGGDTARVTVTLPPGYIDTARAVSNRQIALAGLRLADTLNAALAP